MKHEELKELIAQMTLEEKASLCSGADFWHTDAVERLGIPASMVSDGPHGLRKQADADNADHLGLNESIKAVCFPAGCGTAASFNRELVTHMGEVLGNECQAEGISVILGPAMNIKRSPLCGRNFEYYSEDPLVASQMAGALIKGVQSRHVGTSPKHFLANNQENYRMSSSSEVDERTLREIYLAAFEGAVKEQKPWTVMCSYNKINGVYAAQNKTYLTDVLRGEWGFDGYVMSDWGAVNDRVPDLEAGLDLEMPASGYDNTREIIEAVRDGSLKEEILNTACERILRIVYRFEENRDRNAVFDRDQDHEEARRIAEETIVLLKNEDILPLQETQRVVLVGKYAEKPRYQGGGSSHINSSRVTGAWECLKNNENVTYVQGFDDAQDMVDEVMQAEAVNAAKNAEAAVIFAGLPDSFESEGYDRLHMHLPDCQNKLIEAVCAVQKNVVVVLHNGSPVEMPWIDQVKGVMEAYLGGQAVGAAEADILYGKVNPSAKLPETFPIRLEDNPSYIYYGGENLKVEYREGVFVGYRYYDKKKLPVLFPFGHGLSYTGFSYSNLRLDKEKMKDTDSLQVSVDITNTGSRSGKEVVQFYVGAPEDSRMIRPVKELRAFEKVELNPRETKTVSVILDKRAFAYWNTEIHNWVTPSGKYTVMAAASSRDIRCSKNICIECTEVIPIRYTLDTTFGEIMENERAMEIMKPLVDQITKRLVPDHSEGAVTEEMGKAMLYYMPIRNLACFGGIDKESICKALEEINC